MKCSSPEFYFRSVSQQISVACLHCPRLCALCCGGVNDIEKHSPEFHTDGHMVVRGRLRGEKISRLFVDIFSSHSEYSSFLHSLFFWISLMRFVKVLAFPSNSLLGLWMSLFLKCTII